MPVYSVSRKQWYQWDYTGEQHRTNTSSDSDMYIEEIPKTGASMYKVITNKEY